MLKTRTAISQSIILAAAIIAGGLILGGLLFGGLYESHTGFRGAVVYRVNRFTGSTSMCVMSGGCRDIDATPQASPTP